MKHHVKQDDGQRREWTQMDVIYICVDLEAFPWSFSPKDVCSEHASNDARQRSLGPVQGNPNVAQAPQGEPPGKGASKWGNPTDPSRHAHSPLLFVFRSLLSFSHVFVRGCVEFTHTLTYRCNVSRSQTLGEFENIRFWNIPLTGVDVTSL